MQEPDHSPQVPRLQVEVGLPAKPAGHVAVQAAPWAPGEQELGTVALAGVPVGAALQAAGGEGALGGGTATQCRRVSSDALGPCCVVWSLLIPGSRYVSRAYARLLLSRGKSKQLKI